MTKINNAATRFKTLHKMMERAQKPDMQVTVRFAREAFHQIDHIPASQLQMRGNMKMLAPFACGLMRTLGEQRADFVNRPDIRDGNALAMALGWEQGEDICLGRNVEEDKAGVIYQMTHPATTHYLPVPAPAYAA